MCIRDRPQGEPDTPYAKMLKKSMGQIDWSMDAEKIERLIRGLNPWPSAYTSLNGKTVKIWAAEVVPGNGTGVPGRAVVSRDSLLVETGKDLPVSYTHLLHYASDHQFVGVEFDMDGVVCIEPSRHSHPDPSA